MFRNAPIRTEYFHPASKPARKQASCTAGFILKMSTESTIDEKCYTVDSASVIKAESDENIENVKNAPSFTEILTADLKMLRNILLLLPNERPEEIMEIIKERLDQHYYRITNSENPELNDVIILAESFVSVYHINIMQCEITEKYLYLNEFLLTRSLILLKDKELDRKAIIIAMETFNELSHTYSQQKDLMKSLQYLNKAMDLYNTYTKGQDDFPIPISILYVVDNEKYSNTLNLLNKQYMCTLISLIMLSDKVKHELDLEKIMMYIHKLLRKQSGSEVSTYRYSNIEWIIDAVKLAQYFLSHNRFSECKTYLSIACILMRSCFTHYYSELIVHLSCEKMGFVYMFYKSTMSCILTCWVQYGLILLYSSSKQMLKIKNRDNLSKVNNFRPKTAIKSVKDLTYTLISPVAEQISEEIIYIAEDNYITNYNDAKRIFVRILELLSYQKVDKLISDKIASRVEIAQYISRAYKYLAFYEHDKIKQLKLQKRRIETLEDCLKTLEVEKDRIYCIFVYFELAVINSTLLQMKIESLDEDKLIAEELSEIDQLVKNSVKYFQLYIANYNNVQFALANKMVDERYIVISNLNIKNALRYIIF
ncbi:KIF-binding protein-like [Odontomachus brunneus]|uniref:KIF-binding protein-like n=1 Tax=Odontomachus brunneus TaxID=486640 RepID=UPI0013F22030|nr:KIF-binding protein-like [Odontomachus brunneus]